MKLPHREFLHLTAGVAALSVETLPDVPTVAESGHKEFEYEIWFGMLAPVKTPAPRLRIFEPAMTLAA